MSDVSSAFQYEAADDSPGFLLWKVTTLWQQRLAAIFGKFKITQTQYAIMASLMWFEEHNEPVTQADLAEYTKIDKMTVSKAIRKLETVGFVSRQPSTTDARAMAVQFTDFGRSQIRQAIAAVETTDEEFFSCLTTEQAKMYRTLTIFIISANSAE